MSKSSSSALRCFDMKQALTLENFQASHPAHVTHLLRDEGTGSLQQVHGYADTPSRAHPTHPQVYRHISLQERRELLSEAAQPCGTQNRSFKKVLHVSSSNSPSRPLPRMAGCGLSCPNKTSQ